MNKLHMRCVESHAGDEPLRRFRRVIFPVADDRVADRRKLRSDLILQSRHQRNPHQRRTRKKPLDGISKFSARGFGVCLGAQLLKHPLASKIMNQSSLIGLKTSAKYRQILPHWSMAEKLSNQYLAIRRGFSEDQNAGRETIDAMDNMGSLSPQRQSRGKQRQSGRTIGAFDRHRWEAGRFVEDHQGIVLVKHGKLP